MSSVGYIQGLGGKGGYPPNWSELGYSDTPNTIIDAFDYAKYIANNWTIGAHGNQFEVNKRLYFFPSGLNLMGTNSYASMFYRSNLMYIEPIELGYTQGSLGTVALSSMFRETSIEEIEITAVHDTYTGETANTHHYTNQMFYDCKNLKTVKMYSKPSGGTPEMFYNCTALTTVIGLDTSATQDIHSMFYGCTSLVTPPLLDTSSATNMSNMHYNNTALVNPPAYVTTNVTNANSMFRNCRHIVSAPSLDFSKVTGTGLQNVFNGCTLLENVPVYSVPRVNNMNYIFTGCPNLTDTSLDNILQMCISATSYTGTKTLQALGFGRNDYPVTRWQALPHYSDFTNAGWTIGYS